MGLTISVAKSKAEEEFSKLKGVGEYLNLHQALLLESYESYPVDFGHIAVLFSLDADKDGRFSLTDLSIFAEYACSQTRVDETIAFMTQIQALATLQLWEIVSQQDGHELFVQWFSRVLIFTHPPATLLQYPGIQYVDGDCVKTLYEILNLKDKDGMNLQSFMDMLQRMAEDKGLLSLDDESLDDLVPLAILEEFTRSFIQGFEQLMTQLGFRPKI